MKTSTGTRCCRATEVKWTASMRASSFAAPKTPDEGVSVSVWDNEEALLRYERSGIRRNMAQEVENLYRGQFWVKHFQVTDANN